MPWAVVSLGEFGEGVDKVKRTKPIKGGKHPKLLRSGYY